MRKIFIALAAVAALVGCSKENTPMDVVAKDNFTMNASIVLDETRVTVEGEKFTDVKWEQGDNVTLSSEAGASATLAAETAGDTDIRFVGEGSAVADTDTYYAIYPATTIANGVAQVELAAQSGNDAAVLVAKAEGTKGKAIDMKFKPANALLHVAVSGATSLSKAEFVAFDGAALPQSFTYDFKSESVATTGEIAAYTIENPSVDGFFFSLPADLNLENGYVVRLTDASGNVCSKAYNGKTFEKATTTRVAIEWSTPSVTLGVPMTSYSYYVAGDSATANSCANNVIYFTQSSTYANLQNAMVAEAGFIVDGTTYTATLDIATKSFLMGNVTVSSWGAKSVEAFVKTKDGRTIKSAPATVHITGLPYTLNVSANDGTWTQVQTVNWNTDSGVRLGYYQWSRDAASIQKSDFVLPANVNIQLVGSGKVNGTGSWIKVKNTASYIVSGSTLFSETANGNSPQSYDFNVTGTMSASDPSVKINSSYNLEQAYVLTNSLSINYSNK